MKNHGKIRVLEDVMESTTTGTKITKSNNSVLQTGGWGILPAYLCLEKILFVKNDSTTYSNACSRSFGNYGTNKTDLELWKL